MLFKTATSRNIFSVVACGLATTVAAAGILAVIASNNLRESSLDTMKQIAHDNALGIEGQFQIGTTLVRNLGTTLRTTKLDGTADRERTDLLLHNLLADNAFALGVWTAWEPNAYDGKDSEFVGKPAHDATGRYMPYWVRSDGKIIKEVLVDYTKPGAGDYYIKPRENLKPVVIEPYIYPIGGKDTLITTISAPVMIDGKAEGVSGIDMSLAEIDKALSARKPLGDGYLALLSAGGVLVSHPDQSILGKTLKDSGLNAAEWSSLLASPNTPIEISGPGNVPSLAIAVPVTILPETTWYAVISVPKATVFATLTKVEHISAVIVIVAAILLIAAGAFLSTGFRKRLGRVIAATVAIADGKNDVQLTDLDRKDEIGDLARSLAVLRDANTQKARLELDAERSSRERETERNAQAEQRAEQERALQVAVRELGSGLTRLAEGDMTVRIETAFAGSMDQLRIDFNNSVDKLQEAMLSFSDNAATIHAGSEEIRTAADAMARRTEQQAASVEQTAAALEEITTSVKDSTRRAEDASQMVNRTKQGAEHSGIVVRSAVEAMSAIERSSQEISNIIGVIDEIAFQTNLLALNAGVEAARAGDAGKGFAVVAQEVRELAQRSAKAAKEIKALINSSGEQVRRGVDLVGQTGGALETIVTEVQDIDVNVQAIVQAAREQSTGLQEINSAVNVIDQGTQQNAAMVEESNAASHTLFGEVSALSARLSQFELGNARTAQRDTAALRPVAPRAPAAAPKPTASRIEPARPSARPVQSPARALGNKLANAFGGRPAAASSAAAAESNWEEF